MEHVRYDAKHVTPGGQLLEWGLLAGAGLAIAAAGLAFLDAPLHGGGRNTIPLLLLTALLGGIALVVRRAGTARVRILRGEGTTTVEIHAGGKTFVYRGPFQVRRTWEPLRRGKPQADLRVTARMLTLSVTDAEGTPFLSVGDSRPIEEPLKGAWKRGTTGGEPVRHSLGVSALADLDELASLLTRGKND